MTPEERAELDALRQRIEEQWRWTSNIQGSLEGELRRAFRRIQQLRLAVEASLRYSNYVVLLNATPDGEGRQRMAERMNAALADINKALNDRSFRIGSEIEDFRAFEGDG